MASKAAPPAAADPDLQYIMTCIKHLPTKFAPDFDEVAKESGKKGRIAARLHLNKILRKWGIRQGRKLAGEAASPATPKSTIKRAQIEKDQENDDMEAPDSGQDDTEETPSKKAKIVKKVEVAHADDNEK